MSGFFFNKVAELRPANQLKKETTTQVFSCDFKKLLRIALFKNCASMSVGSLFLFFFGADAIRSTTAGSTTDRRITA